MDLESKINAVLGTMRSARKPLRSKRMEFFGGGPARFDTLEEAILPHHGLCRLDRDSILERRGRVKRYYVRCGIDSQGIAKGGGSPFKRLSDARKQWAHLVARNT